MLGTEGLHVFDEHLSAHGQTRAELAAPWPELVKEFVAALAGAIETEAVASFGALGGRERVEPHVFLPGIGAQPVKGVLADGAEALRRRDGVGLRREAGTGVEGVAAVARGVRAGGEDPIGSVGAAGVVVEVAAFRQVVEQRVELGRARGGAELVKARGKIGGGEPRAEDQGQEEECRRTHGPRERDAAGRASAQAFRKKGARCFTLSHRFRDRPARPRDRTGLSRNRQKASGNWYEMRRSATGEHSLIDHESVVS